MSVSIISADDHQDFAGGPVLKGNLYSHSRKACYPPQVLLRAVNAGFGGICWVCACIPLKHLSASFCSATFTDEHKIYDKKKILAGKKNALCCMV